MRLGFIGTGDGSEAMLANIQKHDVTAMVFHPDRGFLRRAAERGATVTPSARELAAQSDVIVTNFPSAKNLREVFEEQEGIFAGARPGTVIVDCSCLTPAYAREMFARGSALGVHLADAPASGGPQDARFGTLAFSVGADLKVFKLILPILRMMGRFALHCGGPGAGQAARISNTVFWAASRAATSEAMALGVSLGVRASNLAAFIDACNEHFWVADDYVPRAHRRRAANGQRKSDLSIESAFRDISQALDSAKEVESTLILTPVIKELLGKSIESGWGRKDTTYLSNFYRNSERPAPLSSRE